MEKGYYVGLWDSNPFCKESQSTIKMEKGYYTTGKDFTAFGSYGRNPQ